MGELFSRKCLDIPKHLHFHIDRNYIVMTKTVAPVCYADQCKFASLQDVLLQQDHAVSPFGVLLVGVLHLISLWAFSSDRFHALNAFSAPFVVGLGSSIA